MPRRPLSVALALALALALGLAAAPAPAGAARNLEVEIMDDQLLLGAPQARVEQAMDVFRALGVDRVKVSAFWRDHAPRPRRRTRPRNFDAADHRSRGYQWWQLDRVVESARRHGFGVTLSITTPGPIWASKAPRRRNPVWKPRSNEFARFARAVASRYAAFVDRYAVMNEPTQGAWLQPQSDRRGLWAPHHYRRMLRRAYGAIKRADSGSLVLGGELASSGRDDRGFTRPVRPLLFLRTMGCRDARYRARRSGRCRRFRPAPMDALGHHPYNFLSPPRTRSRHRDDAAIGDGARLRRVLDRLVARRALRSRRTRRLDIHYTEFGYQTDPPDPYAGISLRRQDRWLQEAAFIAWLSPRVRTLTQFRLTDGRLRAGDGRLRYAEFQSGLMFSPTRVKPAFRSFPDPFWIADTRPRRGRFIRLWGQVRPGGARTVTLERRPRGSRRWRRVARKRTNARGYFEHRVRPASGRYRFRWAGGRSSSRYVRVR